MKKFCEIPDSQNAKNQSFLQNLNKMYVENKLKVLLKSLSE